MALPRRRGARLLRAHLVESRRHLRPEARLPAQHREPRREPHREPLPRRLLAGLRLPFPFQCLFPSFLCPHPERRRQRHRERRRQRHPERRRHRQVRPQRRHHQVRRQRRHHQVRRHRHHRQVRRHRRHHRAGPRRSEPTRVRCGSSWGGSAPHRQPRSSHRLARWQLFPRAKSGPRGQACARATRSTMLTSAARQRSNRFEEAPCSKVT
jgi:hypothetical protein